MIPQPCPPAAQREGPTPDRRLPSPPHPGTGEGTRAPGGQPLGRGETCKLHRRRPGRELLSFSLMLKWNNAEWSGVIWGPAVFSKCQHSVNITDNTVYKAFAFKYMMLVVTYSNPVKTLILKNKAKLKEMHDLSTSGYVAEQDPSLCFLIPFCFTTLLGTVAWITQN